HCRLPVDFIPPGGYFLRFASLTRPTRYSIIDQILFSCENYTENIFACLINRPDSARPTSRPAPRQGAPKRSDGGLVLVVVLVLERLGQRLRTLAHPVLVRIKALDQFRKHGHNTSFSWSKFEGQTMHESNSVAHKLTALFWAGTFPTDSRTRTTTSTRRNLWLRLRRAVINEG